MFGQAARPGWPKRVLSAAAARVSGGKRTATTTPTISDDRRFASGKRTVVGEDGHRPDGAGRKREVGACAHDVRVVRRRSERKHRTVAERQVAPASINVVCVPHARHARKPRRARRRSRLVKSSRPGEPQSIARCDSEFVRETKQGSAGLTAASR